MIGGDLISTFWRSQFDNGSGGGRRERKRLVAKQKWGGEHCSQSWSKSFRSIQTLRTKCQAQRRVQVCGQIRGRSLKYQCKLMQFNEWMWAKTSTQMFWSFTINALRNQVFEGLALYTPTYFWSDLWQQMERYETYRHSDNAMAALKQV